MKTRMKPKEKTLSAYAIILKALANETRLEILYSLYEQPRKWDDLIFELRVNPKSLRDHLRFLMNSNLVRRKKPAGFELTAAGKAFIDLSLKDIVKTVEKAVEIAEA